MYFIYVFHKMTLINNPGSGKPGLILGKFIRFAFIQIGTKTLKCKEIIES